MTFSFYNDAGMNKELTGSSDSPIPGNPEPVAVWRHFGAISAIPRCSRAEDKARGYVITRARESGLAYRQDRAGNVVVYKPASPGYERIPPVVLQGHLDMVCEKNQDNQHDFDRHGIQLIRDGDWIRARDTTLGADNGIAVAMMLAILESPEPFGALECLFTVDEESGITGALGLDPDLISGRLLINLDSEDEGVFCIGCAGGCNTYLEVPVVRDAHTAEGTRVRIRVTGLRGGHSGVDIHEERGNSIVLGARLLRTLENTHQTVRLVHIAGGGKHNAIPRELHLDLVCTDPDSTDTADLERTLVEQQRLFRDELGAREPDLELRLEPIGDRTAEVVPRTLTRQSCAALTDALLALPNGVLGMSSVVPGLVETSSNLASVQLNGEVVEILTSQRSSRISLIDWAAEKAASVARLAGGRARFAERYPSWTPDRDSALLKTATGTYERLFGTAPRATAVHAGLECGVIREKVGPMDMISLGPDIEGAHTPRERVSIPSTERIWQLLIAILKSI